MKKYVVISKESQTEVHMRNKVGKSVLISFAQAPIWTTFYWIKKQGHKLPNYYDKKTAEYALKKYGNPKDHEILPYEDALKEFQDFDYEKQ